MSYSLQLFVEVLTLQAVPAKKNVSSIPEKKTLQAVPVLEGTLKIHGIIHKIAPVCLRSRKRHSFTVSSLNSIRDYFRLRKQHSVLFSLYFNSFRSFQPKPKRPTCHLLVLSQRGAASSTRKKMMLRYIGIVWFFFICVQLSSSCKMSKFKNSIILTHGHCVIFFYPCHIIVLLRHLNVKFGYKYVPM